MKTLVELPIDPHLPRLAARLSEGNLVVVAEPGAGKTTRLPPYLCRGAGDGKVLVLEPRRLAARLAARRVAAELGERVGEAVGYQVRFENATGPRTRLVYATEGVVVRRFASDPLLRDVDVLVIDEFHERRLDADLTLALARDLQRRVRPELRIVVMSATLAAEPVARFLGAPIESIGGAMFDVEVEFAARPDARPLEARVAGAIRRLTATTPTGDVLVFLPGAAEIRRAREACEEVLPRGALDLLVLHGDLPLEEQDRVLAPSVRRKVILSTNVAETSLTIEGVVAVVDSGLARTSRHSPWSGVASRTVAPISRASVRQRTGRAGRVGPGRCVRLFTKEDFDARPEHDPPEIRRADLVSLALELVGLGHRELEAFPFFEAPGAPSLKAAVDVLRALGAVDAAGAPTPLGSALRALPLHPRIGRVLIEAHRHGRTGAGCAAAAVLSERDLRRGARTRLDGGTGRATPSDASDLGARLDALSAAEAAGFDAASLRHLELDVAAARAVDRARRELERLTRRWQDCGAPSEPEEVTLRRALLAGFSDRVARRRAPGSSELLLSGGGAAALHAESCVRDAEYLVALEAEEVRGKPVVRMASSIEPEWLLEGYGDRVRETTELRFDRARGLVVESTELRFDGLCLDTAERPARPSDAAGQVLCEAARGEGLDALLDLEGDARWRARARFAASVEPLPEVERLPTAEAIVEELSRGCVSLAELRARAAGTTVRSRLSAGTVARIERLAPETVAIAGRPAVRVEYDAGRAPWIASRLQDFFGTAEGPRVGGGKVAVVLHLLAPNQRAVQVTTDLAGFWKNHYPSIRRELMRKYPRHAWPEDPRTAPPSRPGRRPRG